MLRESQRSANAALAEFQDMAASLKTVETVRKREQLTGWASRARLSDLQAAFDTQKIQCDAAYKECDSLRAQLSDRQRSIRVLEAKLSSTQVDAQQAHNTFNECNRLRAQLANRERIVQVLEARIAHLVEFVRAREREVEEEHRHSYMSEAEREQERRLHNWRHSTEEEVQRCQERDA